MADNVSPEIAAIGIRLLEDAHMAWVAAATECSEALHAWFEAPRYERAYYAYLAALDREQAAAHGLERLATVAEPCRQALVVDDERLCLE
jgi:hypothetical protein